VAFLVYRRHRGGPEVLGATGNNFSLAGYNLIWKAWQAKGRPLRTGWRIDADELVRLLTDGQESYDTMRLLIDYDPRSTQRIVLIELLDIYLYTWDGASATQAGWTPMMLKMRDVLEEWPETKFTADEKAQRIAKLVSPSYGEPFVEFLYLNGDASGWNWGRNGATNAVFLHAEARDYFRQYF
jgi:hypothetical protein